MWKWMASTWSVLVVDKKVDDVDVEGGLVVELGKREDDVDVEDINVEDVDVKDVLVDDVEWTM